MLDRPLLPLFDGLGTLHHLGGLMPDISSVRFQPRIERPEFGLLHGIRPARRAALRLLQAADLPLQFVVLPPLPLLLLREVLQIGRTVPAAHLDPRAVERKHMVDAAVQKAAVVRDDDKPPLFVEIGRDLFARPKVEMVGRLVNEQKLLPAAEECREQHLGLLAVGERFKRPL